MTHATQLSVSLPELLHIWQAIQQGFDAGLLDEAAGTRQEIIEEMAGLIQPQTPRDAHAQLALLYAMWREHHQPILMENPEQQRMQKLFQALLTGLHRQVKAYETIYPMNARSRSS